MFCYSQFLLRAGGVLCFKAIFLTFEVPRKPNKARRKTRVSKALALKRCSFQPCYPIEIYLDLSNYKQAYYLKLMLVKKSEIMNRVDQLCYIFSELNCFPEQM